MPSMLNVAFTSCLVPTSPRILTTIIIFKHLLRISLFHFLVFFFLFFCRRPCFKPHHVHPLESIKYCNDVVVSCLGFALPLRPHVFYSGKPHHFLCLIADAKSDALWCRHQPYAGRAGLAFDFHGYCVFLSAAAFP